MKILKIRFKNINNLKGENEVSFEDAPLNSAGIFAITGPTGSGKSTLLDVITLALFNKIPRFRGSISKSTIEGLGSVMTHHTTESMASISYQIDERIYTSTWSVGTTRTGNLRDYEMFVYDELGRPLDLKKSEVPAKNEELIGLKYDQFVKSIILSQGQFAKFLKADKSERGQLLENLTGASIYRKISVAAFEKYKAVRDEVALERDRLENIQVLDEDQRKEIKISIENSGKEKSILDEAVEKLGKNRQSKEAITKTQKTLEIKRQSLIALKIEEAKFVDDLNRLETYDRLSPIMAELTRYADAKANRQNITATIATNEAALASHKKDEERIINAISQLVGVTVSRENANSELSRLEKEVNALNQQKEQLQSSAAELKKRNFAKARKYRLGLDENVKSTAAIEYLKQGMESGDRILESTGLALDIGFDVVDKIRNEATFELTILTELQNAYEQFDVASKRKAEAELKLESYKSNIGKFEPLVVSAKQLLDAQKKNLVLLEKQKQDALLIANLQDLRGQLIEGESCPLCGSKDHPYSSHAPIVESNLDKEIRTIKDEISVAEKELAEKENLLTSNKAQYKLINEQIVSLKDELERVRQLKEDKYSAYSGNSSKEVKGIEQSIRSLKDKVEKLTKAIGVVQKRAAIQELISGYEEVKNISLRYVELNSELQAKYSGNEIARDCNLLKERLSSSITQIASLEKIIERDKKSLEQVSAILQSSKEDLAPRVASLGFESIEHGLDFVIASDEVDRLKKKKEELARMRVSLQTELDTLTRDLEEHLRKDEMSDHSLDEVNHLWTQKNRERENLIQSIGQNMNILAKDDQQRERMRTKESELKLLKDKLDKWTLLNKLIGEKTGNKFANFAQGITLQNLLVYANKRLQKLSDRYLLDKPIKDGALTVIDQYQGNIQRAVSTLSGGESFLISLALALSLSDMASRNVNLESLFIDEGFGTLDQESLDVAMNTLEKLQTESQKTVGVISHVEALKQRIHVQIKLEKNPQGYGTIKIIG